MDSISHPYDLRPRHQMPRAPPSTPRVRVEYVDNSIDLSINPYDILLAVRFQLQVWDRAMVRHFDQQAKKIPKWMLQRTPEASWWK